MPGRSIEPIAWRPPPAPALEGVWAANTGLDFVELWPLGGARGPEDVAVAADGTVHTGVEDGRILRLPPGGGAPQVVADTGGRPLGVELDRDGTLIVCDAYRGLLRVSGDGAVEVLADGHAGERFRHPDNAAIAPDGTIYFSDATTRWQVDEWRWSILEHSRDGRVLAYDPGTRTTRVVLDGLCFANGVAVAPDGAYLLVTETYEYRVRRVWLEGPRAGTAETLVDNLPGLPDNVTSTPDGRFWVALVNPRNRALDRVLPYPAVRRAVARLPEALQPPPGRYGFVFEMDGDGRVLRQLQGPARRYAWTTTAREHDGWLYLGSLVEPAVARLPLTTT